MINDCQIILNKVMARIMKKKHWTREEIKGVFVSVLTEDSGE